MSSSGWLGSLITGLFGSAQQGSQMAYDASQAKKNREFQSEEAELNRVFQSNEAALQREWSSQEAERAMDWQEEMYAKYNSLSGKISQAEQAGVNPMLAITGNAVTPMSASPSTPSGASAGSVGNPSGDSASMSFVDIIGKVLGFKQLQAETDLMQSEAERNRAEAAKTGAETSWIDKLSEAQLENILSSTSEIQSRLHVNDETANKLSAEANKLRKEGERIAKITDSEVKLTEAQAALADYEASLSRFLENGFEGSDVEDYRQIGALLLGRIIGLGASLSPKGIVHMN